MSLHLTTANSTGNSVGDYSNRQYDARFPAEATPRVFRVYTAQHEGYQFYTVDWSDLEGPFATASDMLSHLEAELERRCEPDEEPVTELLTFSEYHDNRYACGILFVDMCADALEDMEGA